MKHVAFVSCVLALVSSSPAANPPVNVAQHYNHASRDGLFVDPAFTTSNATNLRRDTSFDGTIVGNVYAAPLYVEGGSDNRAKLIVVTESNNVYALDPITGSIIWQRNVGTQITSGLPCGNISPLGIGITGTPVVDLPSRALFFDAEVSAMPAMKFIATTSAERASPGRSTLLGPLAAAIGIRTVR